MAVPNLSGLVAPNATGGMVRFRGTRASKNEECLVGDTTFERGVWVWESSGQNQALYDPITIYESLLYNKWRDPLVNTFNQIGEPHHQISEDLETNENGLVWWLITREFDAKNAIDAESHERTTGRYSDPEYFDDHAPGDVGGNQYRQQLMMKLGRCIVRVIFWGKGDLSVKVQTLAWMGSMWAKGMPEYEVLFTVLFYRIKLVNKLKSTGDFTPDRERCSLLVVDVAMRWVLRSLGNPMRMKNLEMKNLEIPMVSTLVMMQQYLELMDSVPKFSEFQGVAVLPSPGLLSSNGFFGAYLPLLPPLY
tara:strand:+ start:1522 stop:2439 length:918 start_codon:yes stop_codon:yes gene_type:complete